MAILEFTCDERVKLRVNPSINTLDNIEVDLIVFIWGMIEVKQNGYEWHGFLTAQGQ